MIRISTTLLESFRKLIETEYVPASQVIDSIMGKPQEMSWQAAAGTAWHKIIADLEEDCDESPDELWARDDYSFTWQSLHNTRRLLGPGLWEVKVVKHMDVYGVPVALVAKADHVHGNTVTDLKAKFSNLDVSAYEPDLQWRIYLWAHGASCFRYVFCEFKDPKKGYCELRNLTETNFWPYPQMERDIKTWCARFLDFCHQHRLTEHLHRESREGVTS
jgi:hypothetical protein